MTKTATKPRTAQSAIDRLKAIPKETTSLSQEAEDFVSQLCQAFNGGEFRHIKQVTFVKFVMEEVHKTFGETITDGQVKVRIANGRRKSQ